MALTRVALPLLVTSGCSFVFVDGPPRERKPGVVPSCTTVPVAPVVDAALFAVAVVGVVVAQAKLDSEEGGEFPNNDFLRMQRTFSIIGGVIELASAGYGFVKTTQCRRARRAGRGAPE